MSSNQPPNSSGGTSNATNSDLNDSSTGASMGLDLQQQRGDPPVDDPEIAPERASLLQRGASASTNNNMRIREALFRNGSGRGLQSDLAAFSSASSDGLRLLQNLEMQQQQRALLAATGANPLQQHLGLLQLQQVDTAALEQNISSAFGSSAALGQLGLPGLSPFQQFQNLAGAPFAAQLNAAQLNASLSLARPPSSILGMASPFAAPGTLNPSSGNTDRPAANRLSDLLQATNRRGVDPTRGSNHADLSNSARAELAQRLHLQTEQLLQLQAQQRQLGRSTPVAAATGNSQPPSQKPPGQLVEPLTVAAAAQNRAQLPAPAKEGSKKKKKKAGKRKAAAQVDDAFLMSLIDTRAASSAKDPPDGEPTATATAKKSASNRPIVRKKRRVPAHSQLANLPENTTPHFTEREHAALGVDEDHNWLSEFQCFARVEMMEVYQATQADVVIRSTSKSVKLDQVGVRCRFCAHLPHGERVNRSSAFPSRLNKLYQSFNMMVRDHFAHCTEIPHDTMERYLALKAKNSQGACDSRHYWYYSAQKLGMIDTVKPGDEESMKSGGGNGIEMTPETQASGRNMPPYGTAIEEVASATDQSKAEDLALVRIPEDKDKASPFLYELMSHIQIVRLLQSERVGKRKTLPLGLNGFGCRYCFKVGRLGFSRCYPLRRRGLPAQIYDMYNHLQRCTVCPEPVKTVLRRLRDEQDKQRKQAAGSESKTQPSTKTKGSGGSSEALLEGEYMDLVWSRLGRTCDLTT
eukprot:Sro595_g172640.1 n/a (750) ;mRNA; r:24793-27458